MKKISLLLVSFILAITSCQQTTPVNIETVRGEIDEMITNYLQQMKDQDIDSAFSFVSKDLLVCGSDPDEFWNYEKSYSNWKQMTKNQQTPDFAFFGERIIKVAPDGNSGIVVLQANISYTPNIPWRVVYYLTKENSKWVISFWSVSLVPENKDLPVLNEALAEE